MKITRFLLLCVVAFFFAACNHATSAPLAVAHPTDAETQDFKQGQAFGQTQFENRKPASNDPEDLSKFDLHFDEAGEFLKHSYYFIIGASYQEFKNISKDIDAYLNANADKATSTYLSFSKSVTNVAWSRLVTAFKTSGLTYDQLAKLTGKTATECKQMIEIQPYNQ